MAKDLRASARARAPYPLSHRILFLPSQLAHPHRIDPGQTDLSQGKNEMYQQEGVPETREGALPAQLRHQITCKRARIETLVCAEAQEVLLSVEEDEADQQIQKDGCGPPPSRTPVA